LLLLKKYGWIFFISVVVFVFIPPYFRMMVAWILAWPTEGMVVHQFFKQEQFHFYIDWDLVMTDSIAFLCIAFSRFSYTNEQLRHKIETDHLQLQLSQLKAQLQPHFLFNTLNSLYGMSLSGSKETPRFILLLSQMMQYILYDCNSEEVPLKEELAFLQGYFEIEQKKFPLARIELKIPEHLPDIKIPPLLFLPLVENSFKHGLHKLEDHAGVYATVHMDNKALYLSIENECLPLKASDNKVKGGIGLNNIKKRLELYYPANYTLSIAETPQKYVVNLTLNL
jgi:LytS/YehU family sensor histidine kinase